MATADVMMISQQQGEEKEADGGRVALFTASRSVRDTEHAGPIVVDTLRQTIKGFKLGQQVVCMSPTESKSQKGMWFRTLQLFLGSKICDVGGQDLLISRHHPVILYLGSMYFYFDFVNEQSNFGNHGPMVLVPPSDAQTPLVKNRAKQGMVLMENLIEGINAQGVEMGLITANADTIVNFTKPDEYFNDVKMKCKIRLNADGEVRDATVIDTDGKVILKPGDKLTASVWSKLVRGTPVKVTVLLNFHYVKTSGKALQGVTVLVKQLVLTRPEHLLHGPPWEAKAAAVGDQTTMADHFLSPVQLKRETTLPYDGDVPKPTQPIRPTTPVANVLEMPVLGRAESMFKTPEKKEVVEKTRTTSADKKRKSRRNLGAVLKGKGKKQQVSFSSSEDEFETGK